MDLLTTQQIEKLARYTNNPCVSIFIPTSHSGKEVLEEKSRFDLKSKWDSCKKTLKEKGINQALIQKIGLPIESLLNDSNFWRHQSDGLAIFASEDFFEKYSLPIKFEEYIYISGEFYLKPLAPVLSGDGKFFILSLQLKDVRFYEATRYSIREIKIDEITPSSLRERVGFDYEEKNLQFRSMQEGEGHALFHGHGGGGRDHKDEIFKFYKAIDDGLSTILGNETVPLLVFCQDYMFPIYKEANTYKNLFDVPVPGNPNDVDLMGLHNKAVIVVEPYLNEQEKNKINKYKEARPEERTSVITEIIPAAVQGKIDTLFVQNREELWGTYDEDTMETKIEDHQTEETVSLINLAAKKVIETGGSVFLTEAESMPNKDSKMNALLRYS